MRLILDVLPDGTLVGSSPDAPGWQLVARGVEQTWAGLREGLAMANRRTAYLTAKGQTSTMCRECGTPTLLPTFDRIVSLPEPAVLDAREVVCAECHEVFTAKPIGRLPRRCPGCRDRVSA